MYGPGSSREHRASASSDSSGTHSTSDSMLKATIAIGCSGERPLSADSARTASCADAACTRGRTPCPSGGRRPLRRGSQRSLSRRASSLEHAFDDPVASCEIPRRSDVRVAERGREDRERARRRPPRSRARAHRPVAAPRARRARSASVAPSPTSAARGSQSRTSGSSVVDLVLADVRRVRHDEIPGPVRKAVGTGRRARARRRVRSETRSRARPRARPAMRRSP